MEHDGIPMQYQWNIIGLWNQHGMQRNTNGIQMEYLWNTYRIPTEYQWNTMEHTHGIPMEYAWNAMEHLWNTMGYLWNTNGIQWNILRCCPRRPSPKPQDGHGSPKASNVPKSPNACLTNIMEYLWKTYGI